jgi:hypothetical protein
MASFTYILHTTVSRSSLCEPRHATENTTWITHWLVVESDENEMFIFPSKRGKKQRVVTG